MTDPGHLVLVGLPGAGKTTAALGVAQRLQRPYVDLDARVEALAGRTVAEIFDQGGEEAFRALELQATRELVGAPGSIVSPGGGWVTRPEALGLIRERSLVIWLRVSPEVALARLGPGAGGRPLLLKGDSLATLRRLAVERESFYALADGWIDTEVVDLQGVMRELARLATFRRGAVG